MTLLTQIPFLVLPVSLEGVGWWLEIAPGGKPIPTIRCHKGHVAWLTNHTVSDNGVVKPSVVCPYCDWHVQARLLNWIPLLP